MTDRITLRRPDDWHLHLRDGAMLEAVAPASARLGRAIIMPNLVPPVVTGADAAAYRDRIRAALPANATLTPLMTLYLTEATDPADVVAAHRAGIAGLAAEVESTAKLLATPAARLIARGQQRPLLLDEVEALMASKALVVDACRYVVRDSRTTVSLTRRPVLFALARALGEAWPQDASRGTLIARAFRGKHADESHRARLRVEIGRLRRALLPLADLNATPDGFVLAPRGRREVSVLALPVEEEHAAVLAFLADGEAWSSSALSVALGASQIGRASCRERV